MFERLEQNVDWYGSTNAEFLLPKKRGEPLEHNQLKGVAFACATDFCKEEKTVLAFADGKGPKEAIYGESWDYLKCQVCGARYLVRWPASNEDSSQTVIQRIEEYKATCDTSTDRQEAFLKGQRKAV